MKDKEKNELLKLDNFFVTSEKINSTDETYSKLMFVYSAALRQLETRIQILEDEFKFFYGCSMIDHTKSRIKKPESIIKKMEKKKYDLTYKSLVENVNDVAGLRIVCPLKDDVYTIVDILKNMPDISVITEKDYIANPKKTRICKLSFNCRSSSTTYETGYSN